MQPIIPIVIAILLVALLVGAAYIRGRRRLAQLRQDVLAHAVPARATILGVAPGDATVGGAFRRLELKLTLRVEHPHLAPYEAQTEWLVHEVALAQVQPDRVVPVRVNRDHPERVYPDSAWAEFSDWTVVQA
jgi:hypothetical protein